MLLFPAIDILDGRAVRLLYGEKARVTDYGDPVDRAKLWLDMGAEILHVVDLSGAFGEENGFNRTLEKIARLGVPVQSGGGLRSLQSVRERFETGATRVVLGTVCVEQPEILRAAAQEYGAKIVAGMDAKNGILMVRGWTQSSGTEAFAFAKQLHSLGIEDAVYTDVSRDGALTGVNLEETVRMKETGLNIIASGGIRNMDDLFALKARGVYGAVLGRSIYTGEINLRRAVEEMK